MTAEATVLCTSNTRDFPADAVESLGVEVLTPDQMLTRLITEYEPQMLTAHRTAVASLLADTQDAHEGDTHGAHEELGNWGRCLTVGRQAVAAIVKLSSMDVDCARGTASRAVPIGARMR